MMKNIIQLKLNEIFSRLSERDVEIEFDSYKTFKSKVSAKILATKLGISEPMLIEFEVALKQFFQYRDNKLKERISCLRLSLWLESICKNLNISFSLDDFFRNEELAIKQVRALELLIRDVISENLGGNENVVFKLKELFKQEVIDKWIKNADETGILSGTTFSELSNILLDKNIFRSIEELVINSRLNLSGNSRDSLRNILEDIRLIRNSIAHNKKVSTIQIEALNEYYVVIAGLIKESKSNNIDPDTYLDLDKENMEIFLSGLKVDNKLISTNLEEIKKDLKEVKKDTEALRKKTLQIILGLFLIISISLIILFLAFKQSSSTNEISNDINFIKGNIAGSQVDSSRIKLTESVMKLYGDEYINYKESSTYESDLIEFMRLFYEVRLSDGKLNLSNDDMFKIYLESVLNKNVRSEFFFYALASKYDLNGDRISAINFIDTALVLNPTFAPLYFRRAMASDNIDSTISYLSKAVQYDKDMGFVYLPYRSVAFYEKLDFKNSLSDINLYLERYPINRKKDLERKFWQISSLIDSGLKNEGCKEFSSLSTVEKEKIYTVYQTSYNIIKDSCNI